MKQEREEAEKALALQRQLYETKLQEAMDMNTSNLSSSSSSEHSELSSFVCFVWARTVPVVLMTIY